MFYLFEKVLSAVIASLVGRYCKKVFDYIEKKLLDKKNGRSSAKDDHSSKN